MIMNRKRDDFELSHRDGDTVPMTKRIKSPRSSFQSSNSINRHEDVIFLNHDQSSNLYNGHLVANNDSLDSFAQTSNDSCPNRKRRARAPQEPTENDASSTPSAKINANNPTRKKSDLCCVVCHGLAHGYNFDAISCESCKAFFRRNALFNVERLKCRRDGQCEITLETRRRCKSCRLKKCFAVGMRKEWILTEEEKVNKKRRIEENRRLRLTTLGEQSSNSDQSTGASIPAEKPNADLQSVLLDTKPLVASLESVSLIHNSDVIANVIAAYNDGFQLEPSSYGWSYPLAKKVTALCQILHTKNTTALRLISFYKRLPKFDALNEVERVNLIKYNLRHIFFFHSSLGYDPINDVYHEGIPSHDTLLYGSDVREGHGNEIYFRVTSIIRSLHAISSIDKRIMQLTIVMILFSKGYLDLVNFKEPVSNDFRPVLQAQNFYAEHLWLFMEKSYGSVRTVQTFTSLISKCLLIQGLFRDIEQDIHEKLESYQVPPIIRTLMNFS